MRAFWKTLLFFALAGPLIGLLAVVFVDAAWAVMADWLWPLIAHTPCELLPSGQLDFQCLRSARHFYFRLLELDPREMLTQTVLAMLIVLAYVFGIVPAALAGCLVSTIRFYDNGFGFGHAVLIGMLIGVVAGALPRNPGVATMLFIACLFATVTCWRLTDRWWR